MGDADLDADCGSGFFVEQRARYPVRCLEHGQVGKKGMLGLQLGHDVGFQRGSDRICAGSRGRHTPSGCALCSTSCRRNPDVARLATLWAEACSWVCAACMPDWAMLARVFMPRLSAAPCVGPSTKQAPPWRKCEGGSAGLTKPVIPAQALGTSPAMGCRNSRRSSALSVS